MIAVFDLMSHFIATAAGAMVPAIHSRAVRDDQNPRVSEVVKK